MLTALLSIALVLPDSSLVGRILLAEDRRDSFDIALTEGMSHADPNIRTLAWRAAERIRDPLFATRDSLPGLDSPPTWPEPAWRLRLRGLTSVRDDCGALKEGLRDSAWPVRFRAAALAAATCGEDTELTATLKSWIAALPPAVVERASGEVTWHPAAHAVVALARVNAAAANTAILSMRDHPQWQVRQYAARAALTTSDTATLLRLARDFDDNVKESAIENLSKLVGHDADHIYLEALHAEGVQAVRVAAIALKGSPRDDVPPLAYAAFERLALNANASERDARLALLDAAGRDASEDRPPPPLYELPARAVELALGADIRLKVVMSPASGGGEFVIRLRGDAAPIMAGRILELANAGYYNGLTWQRVEHDFVVQGGSPGANEYVGLSHYLRDELGGVPHMRGTLGMSTRGHDTGDAQWFFNLRDNLRLNRDYTVWGEVVSNIDVVDSILEGDIIETITEVSRSR